MPEFVVKTVTAIAPTKRLETVAKRADFANQEMAFWSSIPSSIDREVLWNRYTAIAWIHADFGTLIPLVLV